MKQKTPPTVRLITLGESRIRAAQHNIEPTSKVVFAAALYLMLERKEPVLRRALESLLWPMAPAEAASHRLRQTLLKLKRLGFPVEAVGKTKLGLGDARVSVDYEEFLASKKGLDRADERSLVFLPGYEPVFSVNLMEWLDAKKAEVNSAMTRLMLGIIARHRVMAEWVEVEASATRLLRFAPYNEEATLALAEAYAMRGAKLEGVRILDKYLSDVGRGPTDLRLPATLMRRRIADRMPPRPHFTSGEMPLVGRGPMMEVLGEMLNDVRAGKGKACLVWGDAGIGKSRLLAEFSRFASLQGVPTQRVQCRASDPHRPLSVFVDLVPALREMRGAIGCSPDTMSYLDRLTKHRPTTIEAKADEGDSDFVYARIQQALFDLIDAVSEETSIIILVEDVHWLDKVSGKVMRDMVSWGIEHPILFAFTGRDRREGWLADASNIIVEHRLTPLDAASSADIILTLLRAQGREIDGRYLDWCVRVAEGNPYFLQELANHWMETGEEHVAPPSLTAVLNQRISRLDAGALLLLQTCSLLENHSSLERIEQILEYPPHRLLQSINDLASAGMIVMEPDESGKARANRVVSRHELLSNAALARLTPPARSFLHRRIGMALEGVIDEDVSTATLWDSANHWQLAGDAPRAFTLARSCATHLMDVGLPSAAAEAYEKALTYCTSDHERLEMREGQTSAYYRCNAWHLVGEAAQNARVLKAKLSPTDTPHDEVELMNLRAEWRHLRLDHTLGKALVCLRAPTATPSHRMRAGIMALMLLDLACDQETMRTIYEELCPLLASSDSDPSARLEADMVFHTVCGTLSIGVAAATALVDYRRHTGSIADLVRGLCNASATLRTAGLVQDAEVFLREALQIANSHKLPLAAATPLQLLANMALEAGNNLGARKWFEALQSLPELTDDTNAAITENALGTRIALAEADPVTARRMLSRIPLSKHRDAVPHRATYAAALAVAVDLAEGKRPSKRSVDVLETLHLTSRRNTRQAFAAFVLCRALHVSGRQARGDELLSEYLNVYRREPCPAPTHILDVLQSYPTLARK